MAPGTTKRLTRSPFLASVLLYTCFASTLSSSAIAQADPKHVVSPATFPGTSWTHIASPKEAGGAIDINQTLEQLGIDDSPDPLSKDEKQARVVDLLRAQSGVYHKVDFETESMQKSRPTRGSHAPGTFWYYNNWDFNVLGTIFEKRLA